MAKHKHIPFDIPFDEKIIDVAHGTFYIDEYTTDEDLDKMADEMARQFMAIVEKVEANESMAKNTAISIEIKQKKVQDDESNA